MKIWKKALSVGLSLVLCGSMVAPAFAAASFKDLNDAIKGDYEGDAFEVDGSSIKLKDDVEYGGGDDDSTITIVNTVNLDLNGKNIDGKNQNNDSVITINSGATLNLEDSTARMEKDADGNEVYVSGAITGGNRQGGAGGGVYNQGTFNMSGGTIKDNTTEYFGGGVYNGEGGTFNMSGGTIANNTAGWGGGVYNVAAFRMTKGVIAGNEASIAGDDISYVKGSEFSHPEDSLWDDDRSDDDGIGLKHAHNYNIEVTTAATCTEDGKTEYKCACGAMNEEQTKPLPATKHAYGKWTVTTLSTCTEQGEETRICANDPSHIETRPIDAKGHGEGEWVVTTPAQVGVEGEESLICPDCGAVLDTRPIPALEDDGGDDDDNNTPSTPTIVIPDVNVPQASAPEENTTVIDEVEVPLAGIFTRADAIGYLWEKSGSPEWELSDFEDVPEDHTWAVAIGWAQDMGIAVADEDGNFRPDDLVLRSVEDLEIDPEGEFQQFLDRYAVFAGVADEGETFMKLEGDVDDVIMGEEAQVIFNEFFKLLKEALSQAA